jgi:hypothetical protein
MLLFQISHIFYRVHFLLRICFIDIITVLYYLFLKIKLATFTKFAKFRNEKSAKLFLSDFCQAEQTSGDSLKHTPETTLQQEQRKPE